MIFNEEKKFVFVAIPKTGTRSVYAVLKKKYGAIQFREHWPVIPRKWRGFYKFTIVRNPYDRFVSMWWSTTQRPNLKGAGSNFSELAGGSDMKSLIKWMISLSSDEVFLGKELVSKQSKYLNANKFHLILETETLTEDFGKKVKVVSDDEEIGIQNPTTISTRNNGPARHKDPFHYIKDQETLNLINQYYAEDFKHLPQYKLIKTL